VSFWDIVWFIIIGFAFVAYLMILFNILADIFRNKESSGVTKALWMLFLVFFPFITAIVYMITQGAGMAERQASAVNRVREAQDDYIRSVAAASPADQIAQAKGLLDAGTITDAEFQALKSKALA
jgi:predicted PurR-regulated permease PerM